MLLGGLCFSERRGTRVDLGKGDWEGRGLGEGKGQTVLYVRKINKNLPHFKSDLGNTQCHSLDTHTHTHMKTTKSQWYSFSKNFAV